MTTMLYPNNNQIPTATAYPVSPETDFIQAIPQNDNLQFLQTESTPLNDYQLDELMKQGYTRGLSMSLNQMKEVFPLRIWIVDNSGSMMKRDGHRLVNPCSSGSTGIVRMVPCSRWEEIQDCVTYHIRMAGLIEAPTQFRLLNNPGLRIGPQKFSVSMDPHHKQSDVEDALRIMRKTRPGGYTPLTDHILDIYEELFLMTPQLEALGKKVAIIIATDGLPSDETGRCTSQPRQEFVNALRKLEGLPVWVVVRLCTDDEEVVDFYNELDNQLELSLEVLDDFTGEAVEVVGENPWINYALPLHRLREMGHHERVFDMLDERALTKTEVWDFCALLFGEDNLAGIADPNSQWETFTNDVELLLRKEPAQWDPLQKRLRSFISIKKLRRTYRDSLKRRVCSWIINKRSGKKLCTSL